MLATEARFFDKMWDEETSGQPLDINPRMFRYYAEPRRPWLYRERIAMLLGPVRGKRLFDMGCGIGEESAYFAKLGATVTSFDISPVGVERTRERAAHNGVTVDARVGDVTNTGLPGDSFDLIHGIGILHHVGLEAGIREAHRLLKPGGRAVFSEHMSNSRALDFLRGLYNREPEGSVGHYSDNERPLTWNECVKLQRNYRVDLHPWSLLYRLRRPLPVFHREAILRVDYTLLSALPVFRHFAGAVILCLQK
jgi:SAM-dependent methyltransferase